MNSMDMNHFIVKYCGSLLYFVKYIIIYSCISYSIFKLKNNLPQSIYSIHFSGSIKRNYECCNWRTY
jgi:hypothetical protein